MRITFQKEYSDLADTILARLEKSRLDTDDGKVEFDGRSLSHLHDGDLLCSILYVPEEIPEIVVKHAASRALFLEGETGELTRSSYLEHVSRQLLDYLRHPKQRYALATSVSIQSSSALQRIRLGRTDIIFESDLPERFEREATQVHKRARFSFPGEGPIGYLAVRVHVTARGVHDAAARALYVLDFVRGTWNWALNYHRSKWSVGLAVPKPVNDLVLAPIQTVHYPSGKLVSSKQWWYQPEYIGPVNPFAFSEFGDGLYEWLDKVRRKLKSHPYGNDVQDAIVEFGRALDEPRKEIAFIKLWAVFEFLTDVNSGQDGASYDDAIKRATFFWPNREYHRITLSRIRDFRNDLVHRNVRSSLVNSILMRFKLYVEELLMFHLENPGGFNSLREAGEASEIPTQTADLERYRDKLERDREQAESRKLLFKKALRVLGKD